MPSKLRTLVAGCGHMGVSHARAYHKMADDFEIVGLVSRGAASRGKLNAEFGGRYAEFADYADALARTKPDVVCISTYSETHAACAIAALEAGAHVFLEKPVADNIADCERVIALAQRLKRKLVVGYILQVHPSWEKFTELARTLGKPLVMRMNLNQQSFGANWETHKNLLRSTSPMVDCGVHYVEVMCRMTGSRPVSVSGIGARLSDEIVPGQVNYSQLQVTFADGSVGWYEAGWGPMMSETAFFVKDVIGPKGCVSIVARTASGAGKSSDVDSHSKTESLSDQAVDERFLWQVTARILGPNEIHAVRRDVEKPEVLATLRRHAAIARSYNISSTPGWIINGKVSTGAMKISELEERLGFARQSSGGRAVSPGGNGTTTQNAEHNPSELGKALNATLRDAAPHNRLTSLSQSIQPEHHVSSVEHKNNQLGEAAVAWAAYDVEAAVAWVRGLPDSAEKTDALVRLSSQWAEIDPRGAAAYAQIQDNLPMIAKVAAKWAESDPETAGAWAAQLPMGRARQHALASLIATWAEQSPLDAVKYVDSLPPSDAAQQQARISILARWANSDPDLVADWMEALRGTVLADNVLGRVIVPWSQYNPTEVAGWLSTMPAGRARDDAVNAFAGVIEGQEPETAFHWTASIGDDSVRNIRMESAARAWLQKDRSSARPAILGSALSAESKQRLLGAPNG